MHLRTVPVLLRLIGAYAVSGWALAALIMATDADVSGLQAVVRAEAGRGLGAGLLLGLVAAPIARAWRPPPWGAALMGMASVVVGTWMYFWAWPHEWQGPRLDAWKPTKVILGTYWRFVLPVGALGGLAIWALLGPAPPAGAPGYEEPPSR
jgi:xanthosine utilization system XapX-like protein